METKRIDYNKYLQRMSSDNAVVRVADKFRRELMSETVIDEFIKRQKITDRGSIDEIKHLLSEYNDHLLKYVDFNEIRFICEEQKGEKK